METQTTTDAPLAHFNALVDRSGWAAPEAWEPLLGTTDRDWARNLTVHHARAGYLARLAILTNARPSSVYVLYVRTEA